MDDVKFFQITTALNNLTTRYQQPNGTQGHLKHHQYTQEYDNVLEKNKISKKDFIEEVKKRIGKLS